MPRTPISPPDDFPFRVWLAAQRDARHLKQHELAAKLSCSLRLIEDIEQGRRPLSAALEAVTFRFLKVPLAEWPAYRAWARGTGPRPASARLPPGTATRRLPPLARPLAPARSRPGAA